MRRLRERGARERRNLLAAASGVCVVVLVLPLCGAGCANVKPWEKDILSDYTMRPDRDSLSDTMYEHVYFTREAATGGRGVGGGGCGCN